MNILDIAIAKKLAGGGGGSGTDNYNDLSNLPKINDTTLSGNKSSSALGLQSEINSDSKLASDLVDDTNQDNKFVTSTEKNTWNAKQNAIDADHKLSSSLVSFTDAEAAALASGIDSSKVGQISTNQTNILLVEKSNPMSNELRYNVEDLKKINSSDYSWSDNVASLSGIKFTINEDNSISWVATNLANTVWLKLYDSTEMPAIASGEYVLHGCPSGGGISTYELEAVVGGSDKKEYGDSTSFTVSNNLTLVAIGIRAGTSSGTFYPVLINKSLYDAGITDYVISALPNYDLTRMVNDLQKKAVKVYTYHVNPNESDPEDAVTYLDDATGLTPAKMGASSFSYGSWANAWFLPRPCVLKFDGTVDYYLNPNDYSKKTDGTASTIDSSNSTGNVMLEFPKIWVKRVNDGNGARTVSIAPVNVDGTYKCWSNINAEDKEVDHFYLPAYNGTIHSSKMRSLSGVTLNTTYAPNYTRTQEVTAATANNPTGKNLWYTETWADFCLIYDLLYLMGKSLDVQRTFGQGLSSGAETATRAYVTGTHNAKGLFYGDVSGTSTAVKVLGMENLWGCRCHGVAGLINDNGTLKVKMTYGVADGSTAVGYNTTGSGYLNYGSTYGTSGYVKKVQADNTMGYKIIETAGTDATYYCDYYYYTNHSASAYALLGGSSADGALCGFCVFLNHGAAAAYWYIGGSLSCRP